MTRSLLAGCLLCAVLLAQTQRSTKDGVYTDAQAQRGQALYAEQCASCHGAKLDGRGPTPPLAGADFMTNWQGMSVGDLADKVQTSMPADKPASLTPEQTADIVAYMLRANQMPAGNAEMPGNVETLRAIRIEAAKK
jgi:S-disulfanyl-L-cysteine oxidoreductase SoxD